MKYSIQQIESMSDDVMRVKMQEYFGIVFDDANAILPLAYKHDIHIGPISGEWYAISHRLISGEIETNEFHNKSVCRAIASTLLSLIKTNPQPQ